MRNQDLQLFVIVELDNRSNGGHRIELKNAQVVARSLVDDLTATLVGNEQIGLAIVGLDNVDNLWHVRTRDLLENLKQTGHVARRRRLKRAQVVRRRRLVHKYTIAATAVV